MGLELEISLLARLRFVTRRRRRGGAWGERRSTRRGSGLEFADYRDYTPGDDPRRVDWNLYARLDRPYVRLYDEEEDLAVSVLLDGSASMVWGEASAARWAAALQIAAALGAVALLSGDPLCSALLVGDSAAAWGPFRGRGVLPQWRSWLEDLAPGGNVALGPVLADFARIPSRPGLALLVTDGYDVAGLSEGLSALAGRGHEVVLLHLLTPEELNPVLRGDLRLIDSESGERRDVTVDRATLAAYHWQLAAWQSELRALVGKHGGRYVLLRTDIPVRKMMLGALRRAAILR